MAEGAGAGGVLVERGVDYGLGKRPDVYWPRRDGPAPLARRRCRPTSQPHAVAAGRLSAQTIAEAAQPIATARTAHGSSR